ncbi:MAG TPA: right-handed parallel beta-helix repeat-containing protein [Solirubrobacterales bacterium]|nr:right-handed parallel beta-helix repeat-containing protein [Solirubrobacterales bacterium]
MKIVSFAVLLFAFAASTGQALAADAPGACAVPRAIPNDGADDRAAIQEALTTQRCAHLPAGVYDIDSIQPRPPARRPFMMLEAAGAELFGDGPATVLSFRGAVGTQDWEGIRMSTAGSKLHDLAITTAGLTDTIEQTHAVRVLGPATETEIARVSFDHPIRVGEKSGDCIQVVGVSDGREVTGVRIHDNDFLECDRSGVAVHSGTTQLQIVDNQFGAIGNTDLDFEGTGDTSDVLIKGNTFTLSPGPHGLGALQMQLIDRARVTENVFEGRGVEVFQSDDAEIDHNTITLRQTTAAAAIAVNGDSARTRIHDNVIRRDPSAGAGPLIAAAPRSAGVPDHLEVEGNILLQQTSFHVVTGSGLVGFYVRGNSFNYSGELANQMSGVRALGSSGANGIRTTDVRVESNQLSGLLRAAVATSGTLAGAGTLATADNIATGPTFGIFCDNVSSQGRVLGPITSARDEWGAPSCGPPGFVTIVTPPDQEEPPDPGPGDPPVDPPVIDPPVIDPPIEEPPPTEPDPVPGPGSQQDPGSPPLDRAGTPAAGDTTAPVLEGVTLSRPAIKAGARRGSVLWLSSTEPGTLSVRIDRMRTGKQVAALTRAISAGPNGIPLSGRVGAKTLKPGSYRLTVTASDAAGNGSSATVRVLTVLAG